MFTFLFNQNREKRKKDVDTHFILPIVVEGYRHRLKNRLSIPREPSHFIRYRSTQFDELTNVCMIGPKEVPARTGLWPRLALKHSNPVTRRLVRLRMQKLLQWKWNQEDHIGHIRISSGHVPDTTSKRLFCNEPMNSTPQSTRHLKASSLKVFWSEI